MSRRTSASFNSTCASPPSRRTPTRSTCSRRATVATVGTNDVGMETLQVAHEGFCSTSSRPGELGDRRRVGRSPRRTARSARQRAGRDQATTARSWRRRSIASPSARRRRAGVATLRRRRLFRRWPSSRSSSTAPDGDGTDHGSEYGFFSPIPWVDGAASVDLVVGGTIVDSLAISETAPQVGVVRVETVGSAQDIHGDWSPIRMPASWTMAFTVLWSADGETWLTVAGEVEA